MLNIWRGKKGWILYAVNQPEIAKNRSLDINAIEKFKEMNFGVGLHLVVFSDDGSPNLCLLLR